MDCPICLVPYDDMERRPLRTFCGCKQSLCEPCLKQLLQHGGQCPWDRTRWIGRNLIQKFIKATPPSYFQFLQQKTAAESLQEQQQKQRAATNSSEQSKGTSELVAEEDIDRQLALYLMLQEEKDIATQRRQMEQDLAFAKQLLAHEVKNRISVADSSESKSSSQTASASRAARVHAPPKAADSTSKASTLSLQRFLSIPSHSTTSTSTQQLTKTNPIVLDNDDDILEISISPSAQVGVVEDDVCIVLSPTSLAKSQPLSSQFQRPTSSKSSESLRKFFSTASSRLDKPAPVASTFADSKLSFQTPSDGAYGGVKVEKPKNPILEGIEKMKSMPVRTSISFVSNKVARPTKSPEIYSNNDSSSRVFFREQDSASDDVVLDLTQHDRSSEDELSRYGGERLDSDVGSDGEEEYDDDEGMLFRRLPSSHRRSALSCKSTKRLRSQRHQHQQDEDHENDDDDLNLLDASPSSHRATRKKLCLSPSQSPDSVPQTEGRRRQRSIHISASQGEESPLDSMEIPKMSKPTPKRRRLIWMEDEGAFCHC